MEGTFSRAPHRGLQEQKDAAVLEARGGSESSLLFSAVVDWTSQVIRARRASDLSSAWQAGRTSVPPLASIHTKREKGHRRAASQPVNRWNTAPSARRGQAPPTSSLSLQRKGSNRSSFVAPSSSLPTHRIQLVDNTGNTYATNTHLPALPPAFCRPAPIALPPLSPLIPIHIHPILSHHHRPTGPDAAIHWNMSLPPSTARLAVALGGISASRWSREVAVEPKTLPSMTVRIAGVARPVVVFPAEMGDPIRIVDVLWTVYSALRLAAIEAGDGVADGSIGVGSGAGPVWRVAVDDAAAANAIERYFQGDIWWGGLYESLDERDVWVLEMFGAKMGWY